MPELHVGVIIPSRLSTPQRPYLEQALRSVHRAAQRAPHVTTTICVVSESRPSRNLVQHYPEVVFVHAPPHSGFAELNNFAVSHLKEHYSKKKAFDFLLLLNDDAYLASDFFAMLVQTAADEKDVDVFAPMVRDARKYDVIDSFGVEYFVSGYAKNNTDAKVSTTLATAGCMVLRWQVVKRLLDRYGFFFNPIYYYYFEDVDLSVRMLMVGVQIRREKTLRAFHYGSMSSGGKQNTFALQMTYRNMLWVMLCCWPSSDVRSNFFSIVLMQLWAALYITMNCGVLSYPGIWWQTVKSWKELMGLRKKILPRYRDRSLRRLLSPFTFRTYHGKTIPALPPAV